MPKDTAEIRLNKILQKLVTIGEEVRELLLVLAPKTSEPVKKKYYRPTIKERAEKYRKTKSN